MKQKLFTILTLLLCLCSTAWADEVTVTAFKASGSSPYTYECISDNYAINEVEIVTSDVTNNPVGSSQLKVPANGTLTVSAHNKNVTKVVIVWKNTPNITVGGEAVSTSSKTTTWEGSAKSVVFTNGSSANQFGTITVTYEGSFADNIGSAITLSDLTRGLYNSSSIYTIGCTSTPEAYGVYVKGKIGSDINIDTKSNSGTISFKSPKAMSSIVLNWTDSKGTAKTPDMTPSVGTYDAETKTWSAPAGNTSVKEVTFTNAETSKFYLKNQNIVINFASTAPSLSVSPTSASAFAYVVDNGPSAPQTFTVTGSNLTATVTATLSNTDAYEMRTGENAFAAGPLTDLASGTAIQVRLKAGLAKGDSYNENLTFSTTGADNKVIALTGSVTDPKYAITEGTHTNGNITIDKEEATEGETVTLTATPNVRYLFDSWSVYKTGEPTTTVTVTNNQFTMPAYAVTVDATFTADPKKQVLYLTSNGNVNPNDMLYAALAEDYTVTKAAFDATKTVTDFDLVVFHESIGGGNYNKNLVKAAIEADVPVLNTKSYFYGADQNANDRWKWGAPNAGISVDGATINPAYGNIASHPIFEGVDISDAGFVTLFNATTAKAMQPVTALASGKEGYTLAITPNVAAVGGNGVAIHELTPAQRGVTNAKYLMVSIGDGYGCFEKLTTNGQKLLKNAAAYLIDNTASWTPTTSVSGTITASGWNTFSSYAALDLSKINGGAAYVASATSGNSVTLTPVTDKIVAAGTGLMIKGTAGEAFTIDATSAAANFEGTNLLVGMPNGGQVAKADNTNTWNYVFGWTDPADPGFYLVNADLPTLGAGKAYLQTSAALSTTTPARLNIVFEGATTAINGIEEVAPLTKTRKVVKNGRLVIETANGEFTVSGARVK